MKRTARSLLIGSVAVGVILTSVGGALAGELDEILSSASASTYTASRVVVSVWNGQTQVVREHVEHGDGMDMIKQGSSWVMAGGGRSVSMGENPGGVRFVTQKLLVNAERYNVINLGSVEHMGRPCHIFEIEDGGIHRASIVVDDRSGAVLIEELFSADGQLFRRTTLSDFRAYRMREAPEGHGQVPVEVVMAEETIELPHTVAGYTLVDSFSAPGGAEQGFYSDGFFSFSLFMLDSRTTVSGFEDPLVFAADSSRYDMVPTARSVRLNWTSGRHGYVLVGDLPPDHLAAALDELPSPRTQSMWDRLWQRLFG